MKKEVRDNFSAVGEGAFEAETFYIADIKIEPEINSISHSSGPTRKISTRQMTALTKLASKFGQVVSRAEMHQILCLTQEGLRDRAALSHHIGKIRKELGDTGRESKFIKTIRGGGYYLLQEPRFEPPLIWEDSPYRGLKPFRFHHSPIFFGRSKDINAIVSMLCSSRDDGGSMVWLSGASGVGKSSLVEAGVLPELHSRAQAEEVQLVHAIFRYRSSDEGIFGDFSDVLITAFPQIIEVIDSPAELATKLTSRPKDAGEILTQILKESAQRANSKKNSTPTPRPIRLAIFVDQIDEILTSNKLEHEQIEAFFDAIVSLSRAENCLVVGAVRLDYLPQCLTSKALGSELINGVLHILQLPSIAEVREMILRPADILNLEFETNSNGLSLSDLVIQDTFPNIESLPILGFTLELLFRNCSGNQFTFDEYQKIGGIEGCLASHCDNEFRCLSVAAQQCLGGVLSHLTTSVVDPALSVVAKAAPWREIAYSDPAIELIDAFLDARILTVARDQNGTKIVRLAHEAVLISWGRAKDWVDANHDSIRIKSKLTIYVNNWQDSRQDASYLLSARHRLSEAKGLLNSDVELSEQERAYIEASLDQQEKLHLRQSSVRFRIAASAVVFAMLSVIASGLGFSYWRELQNTNLLKESAERASQLAIIEREVAESTSDLMVETFSFSTPENKKGLVISAKELLDRKLEKLESNSMIAPTLAASHFAALGRAYFGLNEHTIGIDLLERSLAVLRSTESPDQLQLARTLTILAQSLSAHAHDTVRAKNYLAESISILGKHPESALQLSKSLEVYAAVQQLENDFSGAENSLKQALIVLCEIVPSTNRQLKSLRVLLGRNLAIQSKFVQAESISREVLRSDRLELSANDPQLVASVSQYAYYLYSVGKINDAIEYYREALAIQQAIYAPDHWRVARSKGRVGHLLVQQGHFKEAETILDEAIKSEMNANGPDSIDIGIFKVSLADSLVQSGSAVQAKELVLDAIRIIRVKEGPTAGLLTIANSILGESIAKLGLCQNGLKLMQESHQTMLANRGDSSPYTAEMQRRLQRFSNEPACTT